MTEIQKAEWKNAGVFPGEYEQDTVANNLQRAKLYTGEARVLVGLLTRQEYACKGGRGVTFKMYAYLRNGEDTTYIWSSSINGGELSLQNEVDALVSGFKILQQFVQRHGLPDKLVYANKPTVESSDDR